MTEKGVHQGSILIPLLLTIHIHFYVVDNILYVTGSNTTPLPFLMTLKTILFIYCLFLTSKSRAEIFHVLL